MKLELFDPYNIRARLSASILLLAPIVITLFLTFDEMHSFAASSITLIALLAFANYVPILQRHINSKKTFNVNYAADMLSLHDSTFDEISKKRYYKKLAFLDSTFSIFLTPDDSDEFRKCSESAVLYLRSRTRENRLIQEENINYGFCRNLLANKPIGIIICSASISFVVCYSLLMFSTISDIPTQLFLSLATDISLLFFWVFGVNKNHLERTAKSYAKALIMAIDTIDQ